MTQLSRLGRKRIDITSENYVLATLAEGAIDAATKSPDESLKASKEMLMKLKRHIELIDKFSAKLMVETRAQDSIFTKWESDIQTMSTAAQQVKDPILHDKTVHYVNSWKTFLGMYLLFKRALDGTI